MARAASGRADRAAKEARALEKRIERLSLINRAMWELLRDATGATDDELKAKINEIDERDGVPDGKITPTRRECEHCGRPVAAQARHCVYCGKTCEPDDPFA
jgi:wobble nucleotide-excising tRNase